VYFPVGSGICTGRPQRSGLHPVGGDPVIGSSVTDRLSGVKAGLPELDVARARRWCEQRVPAHVRDQIKVECDVTPRHLTIVECRPPWREDMSAEWTRFPIARLYYTKATRQWCLYWRDRHLRFHVYDRITPSPRIDDLLQEIDRDPTAIFWG
jgi:hypothetical protein